MSDPPNAPAWSLEKRLRWRLTGALIGLWLAGSTGALVGLLHETGEVLDSALIEVAQRLLVVPDAALQDEPGQPRLLGAIGPHREFVIYQMFDPQGRMHQRSHAAPAEPLDPGAGDGVRDAGDWRVCTLTRGDGGWRVQVAESIEHRYAALWAALGWLLIPLGAVLTAAALVLHWLLRRAFAAMESAREQLAARAAQDLRPVPGVGLPVEMGPWIQTINELIAKVRALVEAERTFAAQTAHEVRTPLAAARAQAQRLTVTAVDDATRERAQALLRQLDRLARLVTRLLQVARVESGAPLRREPVDLVDLATLVADEFSDARAAGRLRVEARSGPALIEGDLDALGIALRNLIDNALKYSGPDARVTVSVAPATLRVVDDGPGVAPQSLSALVRPFERGRVLSEGTGLGLAIVERIVQQSGATMDLLSPVADGRGFAVTIRFAPEPPSPRAAGTTRPSRPG